MGTLYKRYFGRLWLLKPLDVEETPEPRASFRSYRVVYANIRRLHKNLSDLSLIARGGDVVICSETLVSSRHHISELTVLGFGRLLQLFLVDCCRGRLIGLEGWLTRAG